MKGKFANPKNIFESIDFYYMPSYNNSIDTWDNYIKSKEEIDQIRKNEFGHQNIEQFTLFHYIRQEDRLAYFKQNETSRSSTIEDLLGVEEERKNKKVFIEFEGVRQAGDFYLNGQYLGKHENGVMAAGFDLTPYIKEGDNVLAVRTDNDWMYREKSTNSKFQWKTVTSTQTTVVCPRMYSCTLQMKCIRLFLYTVI